MINSQIETILALREFHPGLNLTVESGISNVVIRLNDVFIGDHDFLLNVAGCGDTFEDALNNLYSRVTSTDYVVIDNAVCPSIRCLRFLQGTWVTVKEYPKQ